MEKFLGKWKVEETKNFDAFCDATGVGQAEREVYRNAVILIEISARGKKYSINLTIEGTPLTQTVEWEEGQTTPVTYVDLKGKSMASTFKLDGGNLIHHTWQTDGDIVSDVIGRIENGCLIWTETQNGVSITQTYRPV